MVLGTATPIFAVDPVMHEVTYHAGEGGYFDQVWDDVAEEWVSGEFDEYKELREDGHPIDYMGIIERDGFIFEGWYLDEALTDPMEDHYEPYVFENGDSTEALICRGDVHLYAKYSKSYTITYKAGEQGYFFEYVWNPDTGDYEQVKVKERKHIVRQNEPCHWFDEPSTADEMLFDEWYLDEALTDPISNHYEDYEQDGYTESVYIARGDVTLYAGYTPSYLVTFIVENEHGWMTSHEFDPEAGHITVKVNKLQERIKKGSTVWNHVETDEGYYFGGWYLDEALTDPMEKGEGEPYIPDGDVTLYAKIIPSFTITYHAGEYGYFNDWEWDETTEESKQVKSKIATRQNWVGDYVWLERPNPETDFVFDGWYLDEPLTQSIDSKYSKKIDEYGREGGYIIDEDIHLYAKWGKSYKVTLKAGEHGNFFEYVWEGEEEPVEKYYKEHSERELYGNPFFAFEPLPDEGYVFDGWYLDEACTKPVSSVYKTYVEDGIEYDAWYFDEDVTIYASFVPSYRIHYHTGEHGFFAIWYGEELEKERDGYADRKMGVGFLMNDPSVEDGYVFEGWYLDEAFTKPLEGAYKKDANGRWVANENIHLYAKYSPADVTYSWLRFNLKGGLLDGWRYERVIQAKNGDTIILPEPTRAGYVFDYWEGSKYYAGDSYTVNGDHKFTAVWKLPETPSETPAAPSDTKPAAPSDQKKGEAAPPTGDESNMMLWIALICVAALTTKATRLMRKH